ncbi:MAG: zinc dependent phospholipase C family protein [Deltaproteobacteria bacterium]|nr:zinc dependent phospholipase C family protein [Deltaproteobacteria bacterium]
MLTILTFVFILILIPTNALAWGMGIHLQVGSEILADLSLFSPYLQEIMGRFPYDFFYGCISADIIIGKKFTHYLEHCHSWRVGKKVLDAARSERQKACAYGYLAHLAMDTIGHSFFVPYKIVRTYSTTITKHTYWEMRLEAEVRPDIWELAQALGRQDFRENDALLRSVLADTLFSFRTNKQIFNSLLLLSRLKQSQKMLRSYSRSSKWALDKKDVEEYLSLAREAAVDVLLQQEKSPYWKADPSGERALAAAKMIRRNLNTLWLDGKLPPGDALAILKELKERLREGVTQPEKLLELLSSEP